MATVCARIKGISGTASSAIKPQDRKREARRPDDDGPCASGGDTRWTYLELTSTAFCIRLSRRSVQRAVPGNQRAVTWDDAARAGILTTEAVSMLRYLWSYPSRNLEYSPETQDRGTCRNAHDLRCICTHADLAAVSPHAGPAEPWA